MSHTQMTTNLPGNWDNNGKQNIKSGKLVGTISGSHEGVQEVTNTEMENRGVPIINEVYVK